MSTPRSSDRTQQAKTQQANDASEHATKAEVATLRREIEDFAADLHGREGDPEALEDDLKGYVRAYRRPTAARRWGPYLVVVCGIAMTLAAFESLDGWWAVYAMVIVGLATGGLFFGSVVFATMSKAGTIPELLRDRFE